MSIESLYLHLLRHIPILQTCLLQTKYFFSHDEGLWHSCDLSLAFSSVWLAKLALVASNIWTPTLHRNFFLKGKMWSLSYLFTALLISRVINFHFVTESNQCTCHKINMHCGGWHMGHCQWLGQLVYFRVELFLRVSMVWTLLPSFTWTFSTRLSVSMVFCTKSFCEVTVPSVVSLLKCENKWSVET